MLMGATKFNNNIMGFQKELPVIFDVRAIGVTFITYMVVLFCYLL